MIQNPYNYYNRRHLVQLTRQVANKGKQEEINNVFAGTYIYVCFPNDAAISVMLDAINILRKTIFWRQRIKQLANNAKQCTETYQRTLDCHLREGEKWQFWLDYADCYADLVKPKIDALQASIRQFLDTKYANDPELLTPIFTASILLKTAAHGFDAYYKAMKTAYGVDASKYFHNFNLVGAQHSWEGMEVLLLDDKRYKDADYGLESYEPMRTALEDMTDTFYSNEIANRAGEKALMMNPDCQPEGWQPTITD